ncbi:type 1 glutamine amidotransferase [Flavobacterium selenitireducens]|uniref:type 1 glutamine amidotransferase n=1 Tax=Flavobacterium selenitireducens TaxID=2722704 RepID=UPI00168B1806|nr:type 1 glutamine amidotransferase [Flavobacterium selenitireducens]MBD3582212.1 type 1 glutamine amidotransferase [Flavobacterium selenitireducens]
MNLHILQHVSYEGPGHISDWAFENGHTISFTKLFEAADFPVQLDFDALVILGGPMNIYDEQQFGWLADEKRFIKQTIVTGKPVLGICLGSQLIAEAIGGKVVRNSDTEIGWFPVQKTALGENHRLLDGLDFDSPVFHWHGDTFELPESAQNLLENPACKNQMFAFADNVLGIQFHPEATPASIAQMVINGRDELVSARFVQSETEILARHFSRPNAVLSELLDRLTNVLR